jgi:hypothetical protein
MHCMSKLCKVTWNCRIEVLRFVYLEHNNVLECDACIVGDLLWHFFFSVEPAVSVVSLFECVISGFCCEVAENCTLLGYYAASSGNFLPAFWDNLSLPFAEFKNPKINCQYSLCNNPDKHSFQAVWIFEHIFHMRQCYFPENSSFFVTTMDTSKPPLLACVLL